MAIKNEKTLNVWISSELRDCALTFFDDNTYSAAFGVYEEITIRLEENYWNIDYFFGGMLAYSAKIIAYNKELTTEHVLTLIKMTYEMSNYGEVNFEYAQDTDAR